MRRAFNQVKTSFRLVSNRSVYGPIPSSTLRCPPSAENRTQQQCPLALSSATDRALLQDPVGFGTRERAVQRALQDYRVENSEWFAVDWLTAVAAIKAAQPEEAKTCKYDLEAIARRNKLRGRTLKSTRYPHLNDPLPA